MLKKGDYVRVLINGRINFAGFADEIKINNDPNDYFRLIINGVRTGHILFDDTYEFEIYRQVVDGINPENNSQI